MAGFFVCPVSWARIGETWPRGRLVKPFETVQTCELACSSCIARGARATRPWWRSASGCSPRWASSERLPSLDPAPRRLRRGASRHSASQSARGALIQPGQYRTRRGARLGRVLPGDEIAVHHHEFAPRRAGLEYGAGRVPQSSSRQGVFAASPVFDKPVSRRPRNAHVVGAPASELGGLAMADGNHQRAGIGSRRPAGGPCRRRWPGPALGPWLHGTNSAPRSPSWRPARLAPGAALQLPTLVDEQPAGGPAAAMTVDGHRASLLRLTHVDRFNSVFDRLGYPCRRHSQLSN